MIKVNFEIKRKGFLNLLSHHNIVDTIALISRFSVYLELALSSNRFLVYYKIIYCAAL